MFQSVQYQYLPQRYGGEKSELDPNKWNAVVLSFEGFLSAAKSFDKDKDTAIVVNILGSFVGRVGRDSSVEEKNNLAVLRNFQIGDTICFENKTFQYLEITKEEIEKDVLDKSGKLFSLIKG